MTPLIIGVRHHSPACARLVRWAIERQRPRLILIEGPADMNGRIEELLLAHETPIAIFSHLTASEQSRSSWAPLCDHSPEWQALRSAAELGAEARFFDLPAWHPAFAEVRNRYADRHDHYAQVVAALCARIGAADGDTLWDHLFEQPLAEADLQRNLRAYFDELRGEDEAEPRDQQREAFMARCLAAASREAEGRVIVVCGGYHAPALERLYLACPDTTWPELPATPADARTGSYLVPFSFHRLDSFTGYEAGMPSPAYQDAAFREGPEKAAELLLERTVNRLRSRKQAVSTADVIASRSMAEGLRRLRGHSATTRVDLLDGLAAGLVKDALDVPLPWTYRGPIRPRTDPLLVEVLRTFSGSKVGRLAHGTPRPPLVHEAQAQLEALDLVPTGAGRDVTLQLTEPLDVERSRVLHRLRVLGVPGFERQSGPHWATEGTVTETWWLRQVLEAEPALIEAGAYGATLEDAAAACLEGALLEAGGDLQSLARLLSEAVFIGIGSLASRMLDDLSRSVGSERSLTTLGSAAAALLGVWRHDSLLGGAGAAPLAAVLSAAFDRGLWLVESLQGATAPADPSQIAAIVALRDVLRYGEGRLDVSRSRGHDVMLRRTDDPQAPPALRGGALGFLWSTGCFEDRRAVERSQQAVRRAAHPRHVGDFLAGLFAVAREEALHAPELMGCVDAILEELSDDEFLVAIPALRQAFAYFPPREKEEIARQILRHLHRETDRAFDLVRPLPVAPEVLTRAMAIERAVDRLLEQYALGADPTRTDEED